MSGLYGTGNENVLIGQGIVLPLSQIHEKWDEVPENLLEKSKELLLELEKINSMEAKALRDDIHVICTGKDTIFLHRKNIWNKSCYKILYLRIT